MGPFRGRTLALCVVAVLLTSCHAVHKQPHGQRNLGRESSLDPQGSSNVGVFGRLSNALKSIGHSLMPSEPQHAQDSELQHSDKARTDRTGAQAAEKKMASFLQLGLHLPPFEQLPSMSPYDGLDKHLVTPAVNPHPFPGDGTDMLGPKGSNGGLSHGFDSSNLPSASSLLPFRTKYGAPRSAPPSPSTSATSTSKLIGQQPPKDPTRMHEMGFTPASALPPVTALMGSVHIRHPPLQNPAGFAAGMRFRAMRKPSQKKKPLEKPSFPTLQFPSNPLIPKLPSMPGPPSPPAGVDGMPHPSSDWVLSHGGVPLHDTQFAKYMQTKQKYKEERVKRIARMQQRQRVMEHYRKYIQGGESWVQKMQDQLRQWLMQERKRGSKSIVKEQNQVKKYKAALKQLEGHQKTDATGLNRLNTRIRRAYMKWKLQMQQKRLKEALASHQALKKELGQSSAHQKKIQAELKKINDELAKTKSAAAAAAAAGGKTPKQAKAKQATAKAKQATAKPTKAGPA